MCGWSLDLGRWIVALRGVGLKGVGHDMSWLVADVYVAIATPFISMWLPLRDELVPRGDGRFVPMASREHPLVYNGRGSPCRRGECPYNSRLQV